MATNDSYIESDVTPPMLQLSDRGQGQVAVLSGHWTLRGLCHTLEQVRDRLRRHAGDPRITWDLTEVEALDTTGALILWQAWDRTMPERLELTERHRSLLDYWVQEDEAARARGDERPQRESRFTAWLATPAHEAVAHMRDWLTVLGQLLLDGLDVSMHPSRMPWRELSATIYMAGLRALPITGLVGVLIGVVVAYLTALQLRAYGADIFIVEMLGFSITRELGPMLAAIIVAGRSGSSMTAQIGVMRLTQELDAMTALGMSVSQRLVLPRVIALILLMPLVTLWTIMMGLAGGIVAAQITLGLGFDHFIAAMPSSLPVANLWIGLGKAVVFGAVIGLTAAHFGLRIQPNTRDLGMQTTRAVVASITLVIVINAFFSVLLQDVGF